MGRSSLPVGRTMGLLLERQLWEERLPAGKREAAIRREARRRLGLPEEDEAHD
jgi:hypothetical protein